MIFKIAMTAMFAALSIGLDYVSISIGWDMKITIHGLPLMIVGFMLGPLYGGMAGLLTGFVRQISGVVPFNIMSIFWMFSYIGWGLIPGLFSLLKKTKLNYKFWFILITVIVTSIMATAFNTFAMCMDIWLMSGTGDNYYTYEMILTKLPMRVIVMVIMIVVYVIVTPPILKVFNENLNKEENNSEQNNE
jgi:ECF transporter S component (folate family)